MNTVNTKYHISLFLSVASLLSTYAIDTINTTHIIRDNGDTLVSSGGSFELGFFSPTNSNNRYVGIWYKKIGVRTVVWVANNENPLTDKAGMLRVIESGVLLLLNATNGSIIWSTNTSTTVQTPVARLLDSGNLVVKDADDDNPENFHWQSFNYPTDTSLPGMKLGKNFVTGLEVHITSPKNNGEYASGDYTYHCDPTGYPQNVIKKGDVVTYRTGPWNGKGFSGNPNLQRNTIYTYGVVINEKEVYYHYELINDSLITRFTISESGVGRRWIWVERTQEWNSYLTIPVDNCDVYNGCGPYGSCNIKNSPSCGCLDKFKPNDPQGWERGDWSSGCIRSTPLNCQKEDGFVKYPDIKLPDTRSSRYNKSMTLEECKQVCSKNCSCMAYSSLDISSGENGCLLWFGDLLDIREVSPGQEIYIRIASSELGSGGKTRKTIIITLSLVAGVLLLFLVVYSRRRKKSACRLQGWMGPNYSISTACATSNFCILNAANHIIRGEADVMLCGGSDAVIIPIGLGGFVACRALSQRNTKTKFKKVLTSLSEEVEESGQLAQLTELCELLSFCSDSSLSSPMVDSFSPVLVQLARHDTNSDIMLLAIGAINLGKVCSGNITVEEAISVQVKKELNQSFMPHRLNLL